MTEEKALRQLLAKLLEWGDAHVGFDAAVAGIPVKFRGVRPAGAPHSLWQLVEHLRIAIRHPRFLRQPAVRGTEVARRLLAG